jgi:AcrR family transcriptional regulator
MVQSETGAIPRKRVPRAEREQLMLEAAEREFGRLGFAATSMDEIARGSGITKALLYEYFGSKEGLYDACMERVRGRLFDSVEDALASIPQGRQRLRTFIDTYFRFLDEHRGQRWLLYSEISAGSANALRLLNAGAIVRMLRDGLPVALDETDLEVLAHGLVGAGEQVGRWWLEQDDHPRADAVARFEAMAAALTADAVARATPEETR